jgi:hypothetical protein
MDKEDPGQEIPDVADGESRAESVAAHQLDSHHGHHLRDAFHRLAEAGMQAEQDATVDIVETDRQLRMGLLEKLLRCIALLPLPGPGWVVIIVGLGILPFAWAQRTIRLIRRKVPGIPEDGRIPVHTWIIMISIVVVMALLAMKFGGTVGEWASELWGDLWG